MADPKPVAESVKPTLEERREAAREKRAQEPPPKPDKKAESKKRVDRLTPEQRHRRNVELIARNFQRVNSAFAMRLEDEEFAVSDDEALQWAEAFDETREWAGIGEAPPPLILLAITLNIYIPRAFHYWVTHRDYGELEEGDEIDMDRPPPYVGDGVAAE